MTISQIRNLIEFTFIFMNDNSQYYGISQSSPSNIKNNYELLINLPPKRWNHGYSNEFQLFLNSTYYKHWGDSIPKETELVIQYLFVVSRLLVRRSKLSPRDMVKYFSVYIGNMDDINDRIDASSSKAKRDMVDRYMNRHSRVIKILTLQ